MESVLIDEIKFFYKALFGENPPEKLVYYYIKAHSNIIRLSDFDYAQFETVQMIINKNLDCVGIEPWLRNNKQRHLLSSKLILVTYLAESGADFDYFARNKKRSKLKFILCLIFSIFILMRGYYQKYKYGLL